MRASHRKIVKIQYSVWQKILTEMKYLCIAMHNNMILTSHQTNLSAQLRKSSARYVLLCFKQWHKAYTQNIVKNMKRPSRPYSKYINIASVTEVTSSSYDIFCRLRIFSISVEKCNWEPIVWCNKWDDEGIWSSLIPQPSFFIVKC